jgi:hypothetical protein
MKLADRTTRISGSPTMKVTATVDRLRREGVEVIDFGAGEPDFATPEPIKTAGHDAITANFTKYTPSSGVVELKRAIADRYRLDYGVEYAESEVMVTAGGNFEVIPVVRRHEELPAVPRIVIAVRAALARGRARLTIGAGAGLQLMDLGMPRARPEQRHRDRHELPAADAAGSRLRLDDRWMQRTRVGGVEPDRHERHAAAWTRPGAIRDHIGIHRAAEGDRRRRGRV